MDRTLGRRRSVRGGRDRATNAWLLGIGAIDCTDTYAAVSKTPARAIMLEICWAAKGRPVWPRSPLLPRRLFRPARSSWLKFSGAEKSAFVNIECVSDCHENDDR